MRLGNSVLSWSVMLILGAIISSLYIAGQPVYIFPVVFWSILLLLPYLVLFSALAYVKKNIWYLQGLHLILIGLTTVVSNYYGFFPASGVELWIVILIYYLAGALSHSLFFYKDPLDGNTGFNEDILDS